MSQHIQKWRDGRQLHKMIQCRSYKHASLQNHLTKQELKKWKTTKCLIELGLVFFVFHSGFSATITAFIMRSVIWISLNDGRETNRRGETIAALWQRDHPRLNLSVGACVFGLLLVNSRMNLNGHHLTFHLGLYVHTHRHKTLARTQELVYRMRNGVVCGVLRILSGVCLCVCVWQW